MTRRAVLKAISYTHTSEAGPCFLNCFPSRIPDKAERVQPLDPFGSQGVFSTSLVGNPTAQSVPRRSCMPGGHEPVAVLLVIDLQGGVALDIRTEDRSKFTCNGGVGHKVTSGAGIPSRWDCRGSSVS